MSMKALPKIDKFYLIFAVTMILMAMFVIFTFKAIFSAISTSSDVETKVSEAELRVDNNKLNQALDSYEKRRIVPLEVR